MPCTGASQFYITILSFTDHGHNVLSAKRGFTMAKVWKYGMFFIAIFLVAATASAGTVESGYEGLNICKNPAADTFIDFENGVNMEPITNQYAGVVFSSEGSVQPWVYGDTTNSEWWYPLVYCNGRFLAANPAVGRIDFASGARYASVLISGANQVTLEAYDASGTLVDSAGPTSDNLGTQKFDRLTVENPKIRYVLFRSDGGFWVMDDLCAGTSGDAPIPAPEFPSALLPVTMAAAMLGAVFFIGKTREQ